MGTKQAHQGAVSSLTAVLAQSGNVHLEMKLRGFHSVPGVILLSCFLWNFLLTGFRTATRVKLSCLFLALECPQFFA